MSITSDEELEGMRRAGRVVADALTAARRVHEAPHVFNYYRRQDRQPLHEGLVLAIEPLIAAGLGRVGLAADGWTYATLDGSLTAHHEHTVVVTNGAPIVLTAAA